MAKRTLLYASFIGLVLAGFLLQVGYHIEFEAVHGAEGVRGESGLIIIDPTVCTRHTTPVYLEGREPPVIQKYFDTRRCSVPLPEGAIITRLEPVSVHGAAGIDAYSTETQIVLVERIYSAETTEPRSRQLCDESPAKARLSDIYLAGEGKSIPADCASADASKAVTPKTAQNAYQIKMTSVVYPLYPTSLTDMDAREQLVFFSAYEAGFIPLDYLKVIYHTP